MYNPNDIKQMQQGLMNALNELKNIEKNVFPSLLEKTQSNLSSTEKALFQEFAKESSKIMNEIRTKSPEETTAALNNLLAKYEQRNNNTPGI